MMRAMRARRILFGIGRVGHVVCVWGRWWGGFDGVGVVFCFRGGGERWGVVFVESIRGPTRVKYLLGKGGFFFLFFFSFFRALGIGWEGLEPFGGFGMPVTCLLFEPPKA